MGTSQPWQLGPAVIICLPCFDWCFSQVKEKMQMCLRQIKVQDLQRKRYHIYCESKLIYDVFSLLLPKGKGGPEGPQLCHGGSKGLCRVHLGVSTGKETQL